MAKDRLSRLQKWILCLFYIYTKEEKFRILPTGRIIAGCYCVLDREGKSPTKCVDKSALKVTVSRALKSLREKDLLFGGGGTNIVTDEGMKLGEKFFNVNKPVNNKKGGNK